VQYDRPELAALWGYRDWHAIARGCVTPANHHCIILFITREKQEALTQYADHFDGDRLQMDGETNHAADQRIANARTEGDEIHLFYRDTHHSPFTYFGEIDLIEHELRSDSPGRFVFNTSRAQALAESAIRVEGRASGIDSDVETDTGTDVKSRRRLVTHVRYERSAKNRARAIQLHGTICKVCGFDFNAIYGADLARDFINVHHTRSVTELDNSAPDIETELVSVCANCHMMAHRERGRIVPISELQERVRVRRLKSTEA
jgi:5-methylcytosine-specific restriction protein A